MRRLTVIAPLAALLAASAAGPASGITTSHSTTVMLDASVGSRQFFVEDLTGSDLTTLSIDRDGKQPFRVRVVDTNFATVAQDYEIDATLNNLYKDADVGGPKIPSSAFSIGFGASKLSAAGVSFPVRPSYLLSGEIPSCTDLALEPGVLGTITALTEPTLCGLLGLGGKTITSLPVSGALKTVVPSAAQLTSLLNLPVQLDGTTGGTFTNADYQNGIGADDDSGSGAGTAVGLMTGNTDLDLTDTLDSIITGALPASTAPLTSVTDTGSKIPLANVLNALSASGDSTLGQLGQAIGDLDIAQRSALLNELTATLVPLSLSNILELTGTYASFPVLTAAATAPVSGTYSGTMTVTFVQTP